MKRPSILDKSFRYTPSHQTDISKRFAAVRKQQREAAQPKAETPRLGVVRQMKGRK